MRMQGNREPQGPQGGGLGSRGQKQPGEEGVSCWGQQEDGRREGAAHGCPAGLRSRSQRQGHTPSQRVPQSPLRLAVTATSDPERLGGSRDTEESCHLNLGTATICPSQR